MKSYQSDGEFGKTKVYRRKGKDYHKKLKIADEKLIEHPKSEPYKRDKSRNSLMTDGLGEEG